MNRRITPSKIWLSLAFAAACGDKPATGDTEGPGSSTGADESSGTTAVADPSGHGSEVAPTTGDTGETDAATGPGATTEPPGDDLGGAAGECDPKLQDCPDGQKCTAVGKQVGKPWDYNTCVPVLGEGVAGDSCDVQDNKYSGLDDCAAGLLCMLTDPDGQDGVCIEFCSPDSQCPMSGAQCEEYNDGILPICLPACDPLIQDCPDGQACYQGGSATFVCFKEVAMPGQGGQGATCMSVNICQKGYHCADAATQPDCPGTGCCTAFCALSEGDAACPDPSLCLPFFAEGMAPEEYMDVGVCSIMQ